MILAILRVLQVIRMTLLKLLLRQKTASTKTDSRIKELIHLKGTFVIKSVQWNINSKVMQMKLGIWCHLFSHCLYEMYHSILMVSRPICRLANGGFLAKLYLSAKISSKGYICNLGRGHIWALRCLMCFRSVHFSPEDKVELPFQYYGNRLAFTILPMLLTEVWTQGYTYKLHYRLFTFRSRRTWMWLCINGMWCNCTLAVQVLSIVSQPR